MARFALSDIIRRDMPQSGLRLIPKAQKGDILVPQYRGEEVDGEALNFLRLWSLWAIGLSLSPHLTKQLIEEYFRITFRLPMSCPTHSTWEDFISFYFQNHRLPKADGFKKWYKDIVKKADMRITWFSYSELERATELFARSNWIGQGTTGEVYKGRMNEKDIAVKVFKGMTGENLTRVISEVALHRQGMQKVDLYPDIVHLIGYCTISKNPLLVLEYMNNGNLRHHMEGVYGDHLMERPRVRLSIAIDIATALVQLHYKGKWPIYHRDVRPTNILLNSDWKAKLSDFGLAVVIKSESDKRTPPISYSFGYEDPVYSHTGVLDDKNDVYSFGVVLMGLVTLQKAWDPCRRRERSLVDLVVNRAKSGNPYALIKYPSSKVAMASDGKAVSTDVLEKMMDVALWCCEKDMEQRPTVDMIASDLEEFRNHGSRKRWNTPAHKNPQVVASSGLYKGSIGWRWELEPYPSPLSFQGCQGK